MGLRLLPYRQIVFTPNRGTIRFDVQIATGFGEGLDGVAAGQLTARLHYSSKASQDVSMIG